MVIKTKKKISDDNKKRLTLFIILDGFGLADFTRKGNAITPAQAPHIFEYLRSYPSARLKAHGVDVGLFPGQAGNSEAGHLNIGAGRVLKQDLLMISEAIKNGTFFKNEAFHQALCHIQKHNTAAHIMGLLTDGQSAHAHPDHLYALLDYFRRNKHRKVFLHLFTDGRDSSPHSSVRYLSNLRARMKNGEKIATVIGRFYAMDRNKLWERTEKAYHAMVLGSGLKDGSAEDAIAEAYNRGENDEYIQPSIICKAGRPIATVGDNDAVFFFNARSDRARQLAKAFVQPDFAKKNPGSFKRKRWPKDIRFVAMTDFGPDLPNMLTAFPSPDISECLAKAIGSSYRQLYISETEKYAHVTYFINGGYPQPINGEKRELIRSGDEYSYIQNPGMRSSAVASRILEHIRKKEYDFVAVNFPNADMLGHTGNIQAAQRAIRLLDKQVHRLVQAVLKRYGQVIITADHGNAETMLDEKSGEALTEHTANMVPFVVVRQDLKGRRCRKRTGRLADVAPTLLQLMNIKKPKEMTGASLLGRY
ncbi:MAG: 2,3-bisphosphoglycerate-independent phosphoglycerate mutase [Candidatus Magasanikbacteria bacterium]|nr:2,3-bisphosphoglycerate-independent phosphoglycerate mutase [Candidatus Magasanikbacteria bacterium]